MIAQYLEYLYEHDHYTPKAIEGVRSCLGQAFQITGVLDISDNLAISAILRHFKIDCPASRFMLPKWNLSLVLNMLMHEPYEPVYSISLKHLTFKTCFLLSLASCARVSELHAISFQLLSHNPSWTKVWLQPHLHFLAKNQRSREVHEQRSFLIRCLCDFVGPDLPDRKLCPIRSLRMYLQKTNTRRTQHKFRSLFITLRQGRSKEISKSAFSHWLRTVIRDAHVSASDHQVSVARATPHEVRAIGASLAFQRSLSLANIMSTCMWRSNSCFTSFYLRDVTRVYDDFMGLPPCIAADTVIN